MAEFLNIRFEGSRAFLEGKFENIVDIKKAERALRDAIDDIADAVEDQARLTAPVETGELKLHPVHREDTRISFVPAVAERGFGALTDIPAFGGGFSVRGPGGRFIKPEAFRPSVFLPSQLIARAELTLPIEEVPHSLFVHDGTGVYGPKERPYTAKKPGGFMVFPRWSKAISNRKIFRLRSVRGQEPQPYLAEAYAFVNNSYVPLRIAALRTRIAAET